MRENIGPEENRSQTETVPPFLGLLLNHGFLERCVTTLVLTGMAGAWMFVVWAGGIPIVDRLEEVRTKLASDPTNVVLLMQAGDLCFDRGAKDDKEAVVCAEEYFRRVLALNPSNALARVMLGSTLTMRGRDAFWPNVRMRHVREGLREMDSAVAQAPEDPRVRFERVVNNMHMPGFMGRSELVRGDFAWLWDCVQHRSAALRLDLCQNIALSYGQHLKKQGHKEEARKVWTRGLQMDPGSAIAREIQSCLNAIAGSEKTTTSPEP